MSAQQDTAPESGGKGSFPRTYYPGRQQLYYDRYNAIDWSKPAPISSTPIGEGEHQKTTN